jgi:UDP-N-acetyl-2-amino-2-deoxyglucuronate dehydrogenase
MFLRPKPKIGTTAYRADEPISIAIAGLGAMGQRNIAHLVSSPSYQVSGVFDVNEKVAIEVASRLGVTRYSSFEELLADDVLSVFICTPHFLLADYGIRVLQAGKHLLLEKPMAIKIADADELLRFSNEKNLTLSVNYSRAYSQIVQRASRLMTEGVVGEINSIDIRWSSYKSAGYYHGSHSPTPDDWRLLKEKSGGGMLMMTTCHALHYAAYLAGITPVSATATSQMTSQAGDVEHMLHGLVSYSDNVTGTISTSSNQRGSNINDTTIAGSNGTLVIGGDELRFFSTRVVLGKRPGRWHSEKFPSSELHFDEWLADTASAIDGDGTLAVDAMLARNTLALIDALYASAASGQVTNVEPSV